MEVTSTQPRASVVLRLLKLPLKGLWFLIRYPVVALIIFLLLAFSSISFLAHFNPKIADRFNNAASYFLGATLLSETSDALRKLKSTPDLSTRKIAALEAEVKTHKATIFRKNIALTNAATALTNSGTALHQSGTHIKTQQMEISNHNARLNRFRTRGVDLKNRATTRFTKVAIYDVAGEFLGWVPIVGDAASLGLAAGGIYEMCQMFKEIEQATTELGVPYQVYTDTFCEKPVDKTKQVITEKTGALKGKIVATTTVFKDYASNIPMPDGDAFAAKVKSILDRAYALIGRLING